MTVIIHRYPPEYYIYFPSGRLGVGLGTALLVGVAVADGAQIAFPEAIPIEFAGVSTSNVSCFLTVEQPTIERASRSVHISSFVFFIMIIAPPVIYLNIVTKLGVISKYRKQYAK
jgi:hypothetical protein